MSGVEVAGLVLGALPLIIQGAVLRRATANNELTEFIGIEAYKDGLDPIKSFMGWEKELPYYTRKLRNQHATYEQTIEILFGSIATEIELAEMISDPRASQKLWKSKETALQEKLGKTYSSYQSTMGEIERITKKIASRLDLDRAAEVGTFPLPQVGYQL
jgi:hypothetical protein